MQDQQQPQVPYVPVPTISVSATKNTKGFNYDASVHDCPDVDTAMRMLNDAMAKLKNQYGNAE